MNSKTKKIGHQRHGKWTDDPSCVSGLVMERSSGKSVAVSSCFANNLSGAPPHYAVACLPRRASIYGGGQLLVCESATQDGRPDRATWRAVYNVECERLQTLPEGYTDCLSRREAVNVIGDGWTIRVIEYLLSGLKEGANDRVQEKTGGQLELFGGVR